MKKFASILLCAMMLLSLAACKPSQSAMTDPTEAPAVPTEAPTVEPTPEPTEEPTPEPTEAPTPEPTEAPTPEPTEDPRPCITCDPEAPDSLPQEAVFTVLFRGRYGDGEDEFGCDSYGETDGPNDYFFADGKLVILDTMHKLVKVFDGEELVRTIDVSDVRYPFSMELFGGTLYVYNTFMQEYICEYDWETGDYIRTFSPPEGVEASRNDSALYEKDGKLCIKLGPGKFSNVLDPDDPEIREIEIESVWSPENDDPDWPDCLNCTTEFGGCTIYVGIGGSCDFEGLDDEGNAYFLVGSWVDGTPYITYEFTLRKYSPEGKLIGIAGMSYKFVDHSLTRELRITGDGRIFLMKCMEGELTLTEIELGRVYYMRTDEIREWRNNYYLEHN